MSDFSEDPKERAERYISALSKTLANITVKREERVVSAENISRVADTVQRYLGDAQHYLNQRRPSTALTSIAYAEGLLDALTFLELAQAKDVQ